MSSLLILSVVTQVIRCVFRRHYFICKLITIPWDSYLGPVCYILKQFLQLSCAFLTR